MAKEAFPTGYLQINDLYRWSSKFERSAEYQPRKHAGKTRVQHRHQVDTELLEAQTEDGGSLKILRALVALAIRVVAEDEASLGHVENLHELSATFAVEYIVLKDPTEEQISGFCEFNCVHNVWPFWRQYVYETLKSASLPVITVPFFPGKKDGAPSRKGPKPRISAKKRVALPKV